MTDGFGSDPIPSFDAGTEGEALPGKVGLRVTNGPGVGRVFVLNEVRTLVGRDDPPAVDVDIDLSECELSEVPVISRRQAEIAWTDGGLLLTDLGSKNGTLVNGQDIRKEPTSREPSMPVPLNLGDKVAFGNMETEVVAVE